MLSRMADSKVENQALSIPIPVCSPDRNTSPQGSEGPKPCGQYAIPVFEGGCFNTVQQVNLSRHVRNPTLARQDKGQPTVLGFWREAARP
jgi:hypothetical protein